MWCVVLNWGSYIVDTFFEGWQILEFKKGNQRSYIFSNF